MLSRVARDCNHADARLLCALLYRSQHTLHGFRPVFSRSEFVHDADDGHLFVQSTIHASTARIVIGALLLRYEDTRVLVDAQSAIEHARRATSARTLDMQRHSYGPPMVTIATSECGIVARVIDSLLELPLSLQLCIPLTPVVYQQTMRFSVEQSEALYLQWALPLLAIPQARNSYFGGSSTLVGEATGELMRDERLWKTAEGKAFARELCAHGSSGGGVTAQEDESYVLSLRVHNGVCEWPLTLPPPQELPT